MRSFKKAIWLAAFAAAMASIPASAQSFGERPQRYGNTASFFNYDNRDDQRDLPTNGVFPGNFAADPSSASVGAAGWLGTNPQHQAVPYPSQTYYVDMRGRVFCQTARVDEAGNVTARQRYHACLPR
ncbi:MAG: BA14K family protein [Bradyrhizobium sp.]